MSVEIPHFAAPFFLGNHGATVVEQGSSQNAQDNIYNIAVCPKGYRDDSPEFGIADPTFQTIPLNLMAIQEALRTYEPEASLSLAEHREGLARAGIIVSVTP